MASCGPVLIPSLLAECPGLRLHARYLSVFLATRLIGYLVFGAVAWEVGALVALPPHVRSWFFAVIHMLLACALIWYAYSAERVCVNSCARSELVTIGAAGKRVPGAAVLGFLTGVSLCPPFVAAGVRAAGATSMAAAVLFFAVFFLGTSVWFVPFAGLSWVRRNEAVTTVARMAMVLIALYYLSTGLAILFRGDAHGY